MIGRRHAVFAGVKATYLCGSVLPPLGLGLLVGRDAASSSRSRSLPSFRANSNANSR
jgi:hypothetical protein